MYQKWFCTLLIFKTPSKYFFWSGYIVYNLSRACFIVTGYFLFEKEAFIGLIIVIGIQNFCLIDKDVINSYAIFCQLSHPKNCFKSGCFSQAELIYISFILI